MRRRARSISTSHGATNITIDFIIGKFGLTALDEIFRKVGKNVYPSIMRDHEQGSDAQQV